ncbi:MAG: hypothetical protein WAV02_22715 [Stellaceae bacterium]
MVEMTATDETVEEQQQAEAAPLREWRRLIGALLLLFSPLLLLGVLLESLAWRIGETMPAAMVSAWQDGGADRIWRGGDGHSYLVYKLARVADLKPAVIALGPGRANAFRARPFAPYGFYNAGQIAWTFDQYRRFLELVTKDGYAPRALVFDLDYWMFASGFDHYWADRFDEHPETHVANLLRVAGRLAEAPADLLRRLPDTARERGLFALLTGDGFNPDGSRPVGPATQDPQRLADDSTGVGVPPVVLADHIAAEQVAEFDQFVAFARSKHIALIGVQLPFYAKILDGLKDNPDAGIWREFESAAWQQQHLAASGVAFFDFADMAEYRDKPGYFSDSLDPDARVVTDITRRMLADPSVRAVLPDAK